VLALATSEDKRGIVLLNTHDWKMVTAIQRLMGFLSVGWSADGSVLAGGTSEFVELFDATPGIQPLRVIDTGEEILSLVLSPDGSVLAGGLRDGRVVLWDFATGVPLLSLASQGGEIRSLTWSPDGSLLASANQHDVTLVWDVANGDQIHSLVGKVAAWSPSGSVLATAPSDWNSIILWDPASGSQLRTLSASSIEKELVLGLAWSPDGNMLASTSSDSNLTIWDTTTWTPVRSYNEGYPAFGPSMSWSNDGTYLAVGLYAGSSQIWNVSSWEKTLDISGQVVAWQPMGSIVAGGGTAGSVNLWDLDRRGSIGTIQVHGKSVTALEWESATGFLITTSEEGMVKVWDLSSILMP